MGLCKQKKEEETVCVQHFLAEVLSRMLEIVSIFAVFPPFRQSSPDCPGDHEIAVRPRRFPPPPPLP